MRACACACACACFPAEQEGPARQGLALTCSHLAPFPRSSSASGAEVPLGGRELIAGRDTVNSHLDAHTAQRPSLPSFFLLITNWQMSYF